MVIHPGISICGDFWGSLLLKLAKLSLSVMNPRSKVLISVYNWTVHISLLGKMRLFIFHCPGNRFYCPGNRFIALDKGFTAKEDHSVAGEENFVAQEEDFVAQEDDFVAQKDDFFAQKEDFVAPGKRGFQ